MSNEIILQNKLIIKPDEIEKGLILIERETKLGKGQKCDILYQDQNNRKLYVEVKENVNEKAIEQLNEYRLINNCIDSRYMLFSNNPIKEKYKDKLRELKLEFKTKNKDDILGCLESVLEVTKGGSLFRSSENIFKALNEQSEIATEIYNYVVTKLHSSENPIICNISDGIMFQPVNTNGKILTITTKGKRLLFHFPNGNRDKIYLQFKIIIPELYHRSNNDKNQIDIKLNDIKCIEYIKPLIDRAFNNILNKNCSLR
ncbi:endonuclease NucS domain-containing protein [Peribacillus loiseleuriae]|uniref:endonuclease NucS domain-containing protein n=1 Tax=Peribacillus loiseleuriae TaxID=1679170 RepID=UPI0038007787